jgi:hypothetical protein
MILVENFQRCVDLFARNDCKNIVNILADKWNLERKFLYINDDAQTVNNRRDIAFLSSAYSNVLRMIKEERLIIVNREKCFVM